MRLAAYGAASTAVAVGVVLSAFNQRANFYSACVYLAQSNACLMVLTNLMVLIAIVFGHGLQRLFYGPLRAMEVEQIYEKAWYAVTETCLAMTIFRDEFDVRFIIMFGVLLFVKCFSWIGGGRVEFMEQQPPERPILFHIRLASSLVLLCVSCAAMVWHAITAVLDRGKPNMMVMFAFEFAILLITCTGILARYILSLVEKYIVFRETQRRKEMRRIERAQLLQRVEGQRIANERRRAAGEEELPVDEVEAEEDEDEEIDVGGWEEKGTWVFYSELSTDFLKLLTYLSFFWIVLRWYGLPLHIIRDVYLTLRSFITRIRDFVRYRRATAHMNSRYPDATAEEVEREGVCIICREDMHPWVERPGEGSRAPDQRHRVKKLPCGHVLHFACLRSWLERQQRCPTCRRPVLEEATPANGDLRNGAAPPNGLAFQAQFGIGPFGLDIGVGGPGMVQNFMDRANQQAQQNQQNQANPAGQQRQAPQTNGQQPQAQPNQRQTTVPQAPQAPGAPQAPAQGVPPGLRLPFQMPRIDPLGPQALDQIQQDLAQTRRMLEDSAALNEAWRRMQQQHFGQQAQTASSSSSNPPLNVPTGAATNSSNEPLRSQHHAPLSAIPLYSTQQSSQSFSPSVYSLPPGFTLPPGWTLVPLTAQPAPAPSQPHPLQRHTSAPEQAALGTRRGQRNYRSSIFDYHAVRTPSATNQPDPFATYRPPQPPIPDSFVPSAPVTNDTITSLSHLTPEQRSRLHPLSQPAVQLAANLVTFHRQANWHMVTSIFSGLPEEIRREVLLLWPDAHQSRLLELVSERRGQEDLELTVLAVADHIRNLTPREQASAILGFPGPFRFAVASLVEKSDEVTGEVERMLADAQLEGGDVDWGRQAAPGVWPRASTEEIVNRPPATTTNSLPTPTPTPTRTSNASSSNLPSTINADGVNTTTIRINLPISDPSRLQLFGANSIFPPAAQAAAHGSLEREQQEAQDREREQEAQRARVQSLLAGMLGNGNILGGVERTENNNSSGTVADSTDAPDGREERGLRDAFLRPVAFERGRGGDGHSSGSEDGNARNTEGGSDSRADGTAVKSEKAKGKEIAKDEDGEGSSGAA